MDGWGWWEQLFHVRLGIGMRQAGREAGRQTGWLEEWTEEGRGELMLVRLTRTRTLQIPDTIIINNGSFLFASLAGSMIAETYVMRKMQCSSLIPPNGNENLGRAVGQ